MITYPAVVLREGETEPELVFSDVELDFTKPFYVLVENVQLFDSKGIITTREQLEGK